MSHKLHIITKNISDLREGSPKLRAIGNRSHERARHQEIFSFEDAKPKGLRLHIHNAPPPFDQQANIHDRGIDDAQTTMTLRPTNNFSFNQPVCLFVISGIPIEPTMMLIKALMGTLRKAAGAHEKHI